MKLIGCVAETHRRDDNTRRGITYNKKTRRTATDGGGRRIDRKSQNPEGRWQSLLIGILTEEMLAVKAERQEKDRRWGTDRTEENDGWAERNETDGKLPLPGVTYKVNIRLRGS